MKPTIVAYDGIAVIVNSANPVKSLTKNRSNSLYRRCGGLERGRRFGGKIPSTHEKHHPATYSDSKSWR